MPTEYETIRDAEEHHGPLITNMALALIKIANLKANDQTAWHFAIRAAKDFAAHIGADNVEK